MAELVGSLESVRDSLKEQYDRHEGRAKSASDNIRAERYGRDWGRTKTDLVEEREYNKGAMWGITRALDLLGAMDALLYAEFQKQRLPSNCCTTCGSEQDPRPEYCTTATECGQRAKFKVTDEAGTEMLACMGHLDLALNALGESKVVSL